MCERNVRICTNNRTQCCRDFSGLRESEFACRYVRYFLPNHILFRIGSEHWHWPRKPEAIFEVSCTGLFEKAMLWELIPLERKSMTLVELKGVSKRLKPPRILTEKEFVSLLSHLTHPHPRLALLAFFTSP